MRTWTRSRPWDRSNPSIVTGALGNSIQTTPVSSSGNLLTGKVFSNAKQAEPLEKGTKAFWTGSQAAMMKWIKQSGIRPNKNHARPKPKTKSRMTAAQKRADELNRFAFAIRRKISRVGIKAVAMFKRGGKAAQPEVDRFFDAAVERIAKELE